MRKNAFQSKAALQIFLSSPEKKKAWEHFIHPLVGKKIQAALKQIGPNKKVCLECQLPFEAKIDLQADAILWISAPLQNQKERLLSEGRDGEHLLKLNASYPERLARAKATFHIENSGSLEEFLKQLEALPLP